MFLVTSPIVIMCQPEVYLLAVETMHGFVQWLANLNIKRNMTSIFVNKKRRYMAQFLFYADKGSDYADADVSRLCGSLSPHPVSLLIIILIIII